MKENRFIGDSSFIYQKSHKAEICHIRSFIYQNPYLTKYCVGIGWAVTKYLVGVGWAVTKYPVGIGWVVTKYQVGVGCLFFAEINETVNCLGCDNIEVVVP